MRYKPSEIIQLFESDRNTITRKTFCKNFEENMWFELGETMWRIHIIVFYDHSRYIINNISKPLEEKILKHTECLLNGILSKKGYD